MKIRTDFVTNSSSSSFTLVLTVGLEKEEIKFEGYGDCEGWGGYEHIYVDTNPKKLAASKNIDELIGKIRDNIRNGMVEICIDEAPPLFEEGNGDTEAEKFIEKLKKVDSMDDISYINMSINEEGSNEEQYLRTYSYDCKTNKYKKDHKGEAFNSEGSGGFMSDFD